MQEHARAVVTLARRRRRHEVHIVAMKCWN